MSLDLRQPHTRLDGDLAQRRQLLAQRLGQLAGFDAGVNPTEMGAVRVGGMGADAQPVAFRRVERGSHGFAISGVAAAGDAGEGRATQRRLQVDDPRAPRVEPDQHRCRRRHNVDHAAQPRRTDAPVHGRDSERVDPRPDAPAQDHGGVANRGDRERRRITLPRAHDSPSAVRTSPAR